MLQLYIFAEAIHHLTAIFRLTFYRHEGRR